MNIDENEYGIDSCTMSMNWQWRCPISQDESWAVTNNEYTHLNIWMSYYVVVYAHIVRSFLCIWVLSRMSSHWIYFIDYLYIPHGLNYPTQTWALILDLVPLLTEFRLNPMKKKSQIGRVPSSGTFRSAFLCICLKTRSEDAAKIE